MPNVCQIKIFLSFENFKQTFHKSKSNYNFFLIFCLFNFSVSRIVLVNKTFFLYAVGFFCYFSRWSKNITSDFFMFSEFVCARMYHLHFLLIDAISKDLKKLKDFVVGLMCIKPSIVYGNRMCLYLIASYKLHLLIIS